MRGVPVPATAPDPVTPLPAAPKQPGRDVALEVVLAVEFVVLAADGVPGTNACGGNGLDEPGSGADGFPVF